MPLEEALNLPHFFLNLIQRIGLLAIAGNLAYRMYKSKEWTPWTKLAYAAYVVLLLPDLQQMLHFFALGYPLIGLFGISHCAILLSFPLYKMQLNESYLLYSGAGFLLVGLVLKLSFAELNPIDYFIGDSTRLEADYFRYLRWRELGAISFVFSGACLISGLFQGIKFGMENRTSKDHRH